MIVNNESAEIIRMLNSAFSHLAKDTTDYYPPALRAEIDRINAIVYQNVNNGVYRAGFAITQEAYEEAFRPCLFFDELEGKLSRQRYLAGNALTEADWRLFTTLVRFAVSITATSTTTYAASPIFEISRTICATSFRCPAWPGP